MKNEFFKWMVKTKGKARTTVIPLPEEWKFFTLIHLSIKWVRRNIPPSITGISDVLTGSNLPSTGTYSISGDAIIVEYDLLGPQQVRGSLIGDTLSAWFGD
jgi:xanthine/uracil permease